MNPLIRGLFDSFRKAQELTAMREDDAFELFAASLALPDDTLAQTELSNLLLDPGTPGLDLLVLEINGQIVRDVEDVVQAAEDAAKIEVSVMAIQAKQSPGVDSAQLLNVGSTLVTFLNGGTFERYPQLNSLSAALRKAFEYAAKFRRSPSLVAHYITTAQAAALRDQVTKDRLQEITANVSGLGFLSEVNISVWGADEIYSAWTKKNNSNQADISLEKQVNLPEMPGIDQAILGAVSVGELFNMITDEAGQLDERVFYENVRGFQGTENAVNEAMLQTMQSEDSALLMVLNNGVTVVAESYSPKPGDRISLTGYQIVNGCQTTNCLFLSKDKLLSKLDDTYLPMKVVVTSDDEIAAQIIRATNSQTAVRESDLVALSSFQKRLEDFYRLDSADVNLTYERRAGQFYGKDVIKTRVVNSNDQLRSISAVALNLPHSAARYPGRLYEEVGTLVFNEDDRLLPYAAAAFASYRLENAFRTGLEAKFKSARYHILMAFASQALGRTFTSMNREKSNADAKKLIDRLKKGDPVKLFKAAADAVVAAAGGDLPSRDRLKGAPFTQDLLRYLAGNDGS